MMNERQEIAPHSLFQKLEQGLVLLVWLNGHFGYESNRDLLADMKEAAKGYRREKQAEGHNAGFVHHLSAVI